MESENLDVSHPEISQQRSCGLPIQTDANAPTDEHRISNSSDAPAQSKNKKRRGRRNKQEQAQVEDDASDDECVSHHRLGSIASILPMLKEIAEKTVEEEEKDWGTKLQRPELNEAITLKSGDTIKSYRVFREEDGFLSIYCALCQRDIHGLGEFDLHKTSHNHRKKKMLANRDSAAFHLYVNSQFADEMDNSEWNEDETEEYEEFSLPPPLQPFCENTPAIIQPFLEAFSYKPLVGLDYVLEMISDSGELLYNCLLCTRCASRNILTSHLMGSQHRLSYMKKCFPSLIDKFKKKPNTWSEGMHSALEEVCARAEKYYGRTPVYQIQSRMLQENFTQIKMAIEDVPHYKETHKFNFQDFNPEKWAAEVEAHAEMAKTSGIGRGKKQNPSQDHPPEAIGFCG
ncbi:unnamed protein product [Darwinula stevensoni]|uniref:C2H2-type domain-containing protein n=1 Tax=Darwinula stevensoni TaxID=69355 RepID=A0A7R9FSJ3_9CRUS|nr:unnamed protein product [Darwinula stevensoni]CAG0903592.1 unnamed protein product [Darwinula stevensoni]